MPDNNDYRLYIEKCFKTIDDKLNTIVRQTTKTNSRVTHLEDQANDRQVVIDDFRHMETEFKKVRDKVDKIDKELLEFWFFKKYPKVFLGIITVIVCATLGVSFFNNRKNTSIEKKVNYIESYVKIPNAPTRGAVKAFPDTTNID